MSVLQDVFLTFANSQMMCSYLPANAKMARVREKVITGHTTHSNESREVSSLCLCLFEMLMKYCNMFQEGCLTALIMRFCVAVHFYL